MGEAHAGRLLDHVHLRVADLDASRRFYEAALGALGLAVRDGERSFSSDELYVSADGDPTHGLHLAFQAADEETVRRFYDAALAAGGRDNGVPGERSYHPGYYAAFVLDSRRQQRRGRVPRPIRAFGRVGRVHVGRPGLSRPTPGRISPSRDD